MPARRARFDREIINFCLGQRGMDFFHESAEIRQDAFRAVAARDVVVPGINDNFGRGVRDDDAIGEMRGVRQERSAETAADHFVFRKIGGDIRPEANAGTADENNGISGRRILAVCGFKSGDVFLPPGVVEVCGRGVQRSEQRDSGPKTTQARRDGFWQCRHRGISKRIRRGWKARARIFFCWGRPPHKLPAWQRFRAMRSA